VALDDVSLVHGVVLRAVPALAVMASAVSIARRPTRWWWKTLPRLVASAAVAVTVLAWYLRHSGLIMDHYPATFRLWIGGALLALLVAVAGWRSACRWQKAVAVAVVPLCCASAFLLINAHYSYWPTLGDLLGRPLRNQISSQALTRVLAGRADASEPPPLGSPAALGAVGRRGAAPAAGGGIAQATAKRVVTVTDGALASDPALAAGPTAAAYGAGLSSNAAARATGVSHRASAGSGTLRPQTAASTGPVGAAPLQGVLAPLSIPGATSGFASRQGMVYLPPAFFDSPPPALPVLVMLGGTPGGPQDWTRGGLAAQTADTYAALHHGVAPILAFVDHNGSFARDTECVDGPAGHAETFLAVDVPRYLSNVLHVPLDPSRWGIAGFSEGGTCAFDLTVGHPDAYGTFIDMAGDRAPNLGSATETLRRLYGGDRAEMAAHDPANLLRRHGQSHLDGWFIAGRSDSQHVAIADQLTAAARAAGMDVGETILPGGHNWQFAATAFRALLGPVAQHFASPAGDEGR